jgi:hypothetical protein
VAEERVRLQAQIDASEHVKLQLDHMHKLLSNVLRLPNTSTSFGRPSFHSGQNKCTFERRAAIPM